MNALHLHESHENVLEAGMLILLKNLQRYKMQRYLLIITTGYIVKIDNI